MTIIFAIQVDNSMARCAGTGKEVLSPLEGKFFLVKSASDTPVKVGDVVKEGDDIRVKVIGVEDNGRVKLSRKAVLRDEKGQR